MMLRNTLVGLGMAVGMSALVGACAGADEEASEELVLSYAQAVGETCGGIAALQCADGQKCLIKDDYPDASGTCVGPSQLNGWKQKCALVRCLAVECPAGFQRHFTPHHCCGICIPDPNAPAPPDEGQCQTASDCNDLPHILCVGEWQCNAGSCQYVCSTSDEI